MFTEFGKNILGSVAQALTVGKGIKKLSETSKAVSEIKDTKKMQNELVNTADNARDIYLKAKKEMEEKKNMYNTTMDDVHRRIKELKFKMSGINSEMVDEANKDYDTNGIHVVNSKKSLGTMPTPKKLDMEEGGK